MLSLFLTGLVAAMQLSVAEGDGCGRVVCYHTNWSQYRLTGGKFFPDNIDPSLCTNLIYAFAKIENNQLKAFEWNDDSTDWSVGLYEKFQNLKKQNPALKTSLAVGGWNLGSAPFTAIVKSPSIRQGFITQSIKFLRDRGFDGLDLDWEYPANRGSPPEDKQHFSEFITELKAAFVAEAASSGKPRLLLSSAVAAGKDKIDTAYDVPVLSRELDFINLMSYDLHGSWETVTGHNSPLYALSSETGNDTYLNIDYAAKYWVQKGLDPAKLNVGLGLYGRSFTLASASNSGVGAPAPKAGNAGHYTREAGFVAYYEVCDMKKQGGQEEWIDEQSSPYIHLGTQWVGYDNPRSLKLKVQYIKKNNYGGVMVWALPLDDFSGSHCEEGPFPLMHAIVDECQQSSEPAQTNAPVSGAPLSIATVTEAPVTNAPVTEAPVTNADGDGCGRVVCYHTNWSQYRLTGGKFFPDNIDPSLCTNLIYAFAKIENNQLKAFEWNDDSTDWSVGLYEKFQNLKKQNPALKTSLAVGGWNLGSAPFTAIVKSPSIRQNFITQSIKFLRDRGFDGLDLDWEYPANRGSPPEDKQHFSEFITELKAAFVAEAASSGKPRLLLSSAVAAGKDKIDTAYDVPVLSRELDFINLMSYDLHGSWETVTGHNSPLYALSSETGNDTYLNIDYAAKYWVQKGLDPAKLNVGLGLYGRSFTLASASNSGVGAPAPKAGNAGHYTREAGFVAYYEVCDMKKQGGQEEWIDEQSSPYIHLGTQWVGYDNPRSLKEKVKYIKKNNFGGVMVWALPLDDFSGSHCGEGPFPLMHAIVDECQQSSEPAQTNAPVSGAPLSIAPVTEAPVTTAPVTNAPVTNAPVTNAPVTNAPVTNAPVTNAPVTNASVTNAPVTNAPVTNAPVTNAPVTNAPVTIAPVTNAPVTNAPVTNAPVTNAPVTNAPVTNALVTNAPITIAPVTNAPVTEAPHSNAPVTNAPVTNAPVTNAPVTNAPNANTNSPQVTQPPLHTLQPAQFTCPTKDGFYASPNSCLEYYICAGHMSYAVHCAGGLVFNPNTGFCDWPGNYECTIGDSPGTTSAPVQPTTQPPQPITNMPVQTQPPVTGATQQPTIAPDTPRQPTATQASTTNAPITDAPTTQQPTTQQPTTQQPTTQQPTTQRPTTQPPTTQPPTTRMPTTHAPITAAPTTQPPVPTTQDVSNFCQGHAGGIFADPSDCAHFIECANGITYREPCAPGTAWNDHLKTCDLVANVYGCDHAA